MSTKSTIFLTKDNEHFYEETSWEFYKDGEFIGNSLVLEMNKKNINILHNDNDELIIEIKNPESELYRHMMKMKNL